MARSRLLVVFLAIPAVFGHLGNDSLLLPSERQLLEFKWQHPRPVGLLTVGSGSPVEIRDAMVTNADLFRDEFFFDGQSHLGGEIVPHRVVQGKGVAHWGYFEVTNDVSKYTHADVFNGIGKKTPCLVRMGVGHPGNSGNDLHRDLKDIAVKFYTRDGILDLLSVQMPFFFTKDPLQFAEITHAFARKNPKTHLIDNNMFWDILPLRPDALSLFLYVFSDYGLPDAWRHSDFFPVHTFELVNKHGERWYARFSWRTEQGVKFLTSKQVRKIADPDYFVKDTYNAIANHEYPTWRLEIDVLSIHDIQTVDFDPFDVTRVWKNGTYHTIPIGRLVVNQHSDNHFRDSEQSAFSMANLVPGIPGGIDQLFRGRRFAYRDTQNYRVGRNHLKVGVNSPNYKKTYVHNGHPPVSDNSRDAPIYYPNTYSGPIPFVDETRPREDLIVLESHASDLQGPADFYNKFLPNDASRQRLVDNMVEAFEPVLESIRKRVVNFLSLVDKDLTNRLVKGLEALNYRKNKKHRKYDL